MAVTADSENALHNVMGQIEWSLAQLERYFLDQKLTDLQQKSQTAIQSNDLLGKLLSQEGFLKTSIALVESLARFTHSERVSFGRFEGQKNRILAISNTVDFSQKLALIEAIQSAQLEAAMQMQACQFPPLDQQQGVILRAHESLSTSQGHHAVLTLLLFDYRQHKPVFALTLERNGKNPFTETEVDGLSHIVQLGGAIVLDKWQSERSVTQLFFGGLKRQFTRLFGPGYTYRKIFLLSITLLIGVFSWLPGEYRLAADARLESREQFMVSMPFDSYLMSSSVRPGDSVEKSQTLAQLDQRSLKLDWLKAQGKRHQLQTELSLAQAEKDSAKMRVLLAQIQQAQSDVELAQLYLMQAEIKAPIDGIVLEGDLTQKLGEALKRGEMLFLIGKADGWRIHIQVPESRVRDVQVGQTGGLVLQAIPNSQQAFVVTKLTPMQQIEEGRVFYRVEAEFLSDDFAQQFALKPGMQGVAKIQIDQRNLFGIWARDSYEWLMLTWWRWWG
jgi:multidrug resistance efflux pump